MKQILGFCHSENDGEIIKTKNFIMQFYQDFLLKFAPMGVCPFHRYGCLFCKTYGTEPSSGEYIRMEYCLGMLLGDGYMAAKQEFTRILDSTKRASSLVENLDSRIRVYMNLKRMVPGKYFTLLKVYFNTRKYHRSRILERVGKSPLELMTGKKHPEFFEILGY